MIGQLVVVAMVLSATAAEKISFESNYRGEAVTSGPGWQLRSLTRFSSFRDVSAVFNTSSPTADDLDLGSPNSACGGPGVGRGGAPGSPGENCAPIGNVLIALAGSLNVEDFRSNCKKSCDPVSPDADGSACESVCLPNDEPSGATFKVSFSERVLVQSIRMLDVDTSESLTITKSPAEEAVIPTQESFGGLGGNSVTEIPATIFGEFQPRDDLLIVCESSCALIDIRYQPIPKPVETVAITPSPVAATTPPFMSQAPLPTPEASFSPASPPMVTVEPSQNPLGPLESTENDFEEEFESPMESEEPIITESGDPYVSPSNDFGFDGEDEDKEGR